MPGLDRARRVARPARRLARLQQHLERLARVDRGNVGRPGDEDVARVEQDAAAKLDLALEVLDIGSQPPVGHERVGAFEERRRAIRLTRVPRGGRRRDQPATLRPDVDAERRRPLERRRGRRVGTPAPGPNPCALELLGGVGILADRRGRQMPGTFVQPQVVVERVCESAVGGSTRALRHALEDRRPHQGMAHLDACTAHGHEPGLLGEPERLGVHPRRLRGPHHRRQPSAALGGDQRKHLLRRGGQPAHPLAEDALHPPRHRKLLRQAFDTRELCGRQRLWELDERKRIAARLLDEEIAHRLGDLAAGAACDQRGGRVGIEPAHLELGDLARLEAAVASIARREQHHDPLGVEPAGDEHERAGRRGIQPLRVVDEAQHRTRLGQLRQQRKARDRDQEPILAGPLRQPERPSQCRHLGRGKPLEQVQRRSDELMQPRERQLGLGLDTARRQHVHVVRAFSRVLE